MDNFLKEIFTEHYKDIFYNSPIAKLIMSTDSPIYTILDVNNAYLMATNSARENLVGKSVFTAFPANPNDQNSKNIERTLFSFKEAIKTKRPHTMSNYRYDIPIPGTNDFEERYWTTINTPVLNADNHVIFFIHAPNNVTEQIRVRQEQQKLITLVDNSADLMSILNIDGTNAYLNKAGMKMLGFDNEEEVQRTPISQLHTKEDFELVEREVLPTVMNKGNWSGEMTVKNLKSGEIFQVFNNCIRIDDPISNELIAVGAVMRDMRPELAAKRALADSEELLRNITTAAPASLWMSDEHGGIIYVNQTWINWTGLTYEQNLGAGWLSAIVEEDKRHASEIFLKDISEQKIYEVEFRINHTDGTRHWCLATGKPSFKDGNFSGYIGSCVDITDQKQLQLQKDDFIGIASHELKTPVTSIKAYAQVLQRMLKQNGNAREADMMARMDTQLNRLTSLIGDLLDVTKINSGKLQFNNRNFEFNQLVKELVEDLQRTTEKHTIVENYGESVFVFADQERLGQVITNLITNAIKYSPDADRIIISTSSNKNEVNFCVQDFGIGISPDKLDKVFEQFYRVSGNMQHTFSGLGLGLYISHEIIKREGGRIWAESNENQGATFCFSIPVTPIDPQD